MNKNQFGQVKESLIKRAKQSINDDGYASMSHVFESEVKERKHNGEDIQTGYEKDISLYSSISALLIKDGKNIREPIFNYLNNLINYHVLKNPNYELNENIKATNISIQNLNSFLKKTNILAVIIAGLTGFFIAMQFFKADAIDLQPIHKQLTLQAQILNSIEQSQKGIDSSLSIMADSISTSKR